MSLFAEFAQLGEQLAATRARKAMAALVARYLRSIAEDEVALAALMIVGRVFPERGGRPLNLSGVAVMRVVHQVVRTTPEQRQRIASDAVDFGQSVQLMLERGTRLQTQGPALTLREVWQGFQDIAATGGPGSRQRKDELFRMLLQRATPLEAKYLVKLAVGEMRHGVNEGMLLDAIALASGAPLELVQRANMLIGDVGIVADVALRQGSAGLEQSTIQLGQPIKPMLAQTAASVADAFDLLGSKLVLEYKLDGARVQIHKDGQRVWLFSRHLSDLTASLPEICAQVKQEIAAQTAILEGEVIAVNAGGRPLPFQHLMRRLGRVHDIVAMQQQVPVQLYLFDLLYLDGALMLDRPYQERVDALRRVHGQIPLVERQVPSSVAEGETFLNAARVAGHEGIMAKNLESPYTPGVRGRHWLKIKPAVTLDLVIVAADWGYGRRHGWLSNYHLAARDEESGELLEVGKTFKGLTDEEFQHITEQLLALKVSEAYGTVFVRPEIVVEVAFNNIQDSPQYKSGMALRFARIVRFRPDKTVAEVDTIQTMRRLQRAGYA
ncbi:MAG: ATP-dependent DNA ligase [Chloroflexi bacterium]|nr:ATP-dependent DNA ligase [Chloroflexota bacterium]